MHFYKYHGTGNDFIFIEKGDLSESEIPEVVKKMCHRRFGVGADGLMLAEPSNRADIRMRYWNQDGTSAPMCGNGIRAFARWITETEQIGKSSFVVETGAGPVPVTIGKDFSAISADLGEPRFELKPAEARSSGQVSLTVNGHSYDLDLIFLGTLHAVVFTEGEVSEEDACALCHHEYFPGRINVNLVQIIDRGHIKLRTYERGVGFTLACGTGAASSQTVAHKRNFTDTTALVETEGGILKVEAGKQIILTGPAVKIAEGDAEIE